MAIMLHMDLLLTKMSKKSRELLSNKLTKMRVIKKINPQKVMELTELGDLTVELIEGLEVECHHEGCFHVHCEDLNEQKIKLIGKACAALSKIYDVGKKTQKVSFALFALEDKIPRSKIVKMIKKGVNTDFEAQVKDLYKEDVKVAGIRFVSAHNMSYTVDITGVAVRMGPLKIALDRFKDETTVIELIEKSIGRIKKILGD